MEKKEIIIDCDYEVLNESLNRILKSSGYEIHKDFTTTTKPDFAIYVGGSWNCKQRREKNTEIAYTELLQQSVFFETCLQRGVQKVVYLAPSSIYAKNLHIPIKESALGFGELESWDEAYSSVKITGIKMAQAYGNKYSTKFISIIYSNLYGIYDDFSTETGHVLPSIISQMYRAKTQNFPAIALMGSGRVLRDFLYVDDLTIAIKTILDNFNNSSSIFNVGTGTDASIQTILSMVANVCGFRGQTIFNMKAGTEGKVRILTDNSNIRKLGWSPKYNLRVNLDIVYNSYAKVLDKK
jgi:GDP-L-fucose synthase